jgi:hypothetical protein
MKRTIVTALALLFATAAHASTFNYACKDRGKSYPLKVDDAKNTLEWKKIVYRIKTTDCGRAGWHAEGNGTSFDFCTATQGYADFELGGTRIQCDLKR